MSTPGIDTPSFKVDDTIERQQGLMCKDVYEGGHNIKPYLIQPVSESAQEYQKRQKVSSVKPVFKKGIDSFTDLLFRKPITYQDISPEIEEYYKKANGNQSLNEMAKGAFKESLLTNAIYWLVWTPPNDAETAAEENEEQIRPYIEEIILDNVVEVVHDTMGNVARITVAGAYEYESGRYGSVMKPEYRIYFNDGVVEIWRENSEGEIVLVDTIQLEVPKMPIVELRYEEQTETPAFTNEAKLQLQQYNIDSARFSYNLKLAFPLVKTWGLLQNSNNIAKDSIDDDGNPVKVVEFQASKGIDFPVNPETGAKLGDIEFEEISGDADKVLKGTSDDLTISISRGFIQITTNQSGNKTVAEAENERATGEGTLSSAAQNVEVFLNDVHTLFCEYAGLPVEGNIIMNTDFVEDTLDNTEYQMLMDLYSEQIIDRTQLLEELQHYDKLKTMDIEALIDRTLAGRS